MNAKVLNTDALTHIYVRLQRLFNGSDLLNVLQMAM